MHIVIRHEFVHQAGERIARSEFNNPGNGSARATTPFPCGGSWVFKDPEAVRDMNSKDFTALANSIKEANHDSMRFLNFGPEKHIGEDENRSEIPFRPLVMKQVMFPPHVVVPEFGNPVLGNTMVGFMER
jgi:hypothetical protein